MPPTLLAAALGFVLRYGTNVPYLDDWDMVPALTRAQPVTLEWLWSEHNEHRVPLPRLLMLGLVRLTVIDVRTWMMFDVLAMGALTLAMLLTARRLRARASWTDAFFPITLLGWGRPRTCSGVGSSSSSHPPSWLASR